MSYFFASLSDWITLRSISCFTICCIVCSLPPPFCRGTPHAGSYGSPVKGDIGNEGEDTACCGTPPGFAGGVTGVCGTGVDCGCGDDGCNCSDMVSSLTCSLIYQE